nr:hypothetical protein GCM10020093_111220 [Planobispora longispora]
MVPIIHGQRVLGSIECGPRRDGPFLKEDRRLLGYLAGQAAAAVHNIHLTAELSAQLRLIRRQAAELSASRERVAQGQDAERRRIQRDLHDGVQQEVVALTAKLGLVRQRLGRGDPRGGQDLAELHQDLGTLLNGLREFAYTIHPPVLSDQGLLFDPAAGHGLGLTGLADRLDIVGGALRVDTAEGRAPNCAWRFP